MRATLLWAIVVGVILPGCAGEDPFKNERRDASPGALGVGADLDTLAAPDETPADADPQQPGVAAPAAADSADPRTAVPSTAEYQQPGPAMPASPQSGAPSHGAEAAGGGGQRQVADVGATGKGRYNPGLVTTPVSAYWRSQEATVFRMQIPKTMQLYKATYGHAPKSHDEFMQQIIKANMIKLPDLPAGERYVYDPKTEQLMVEGPAR